MSYQRPKRLIDAEWNDLGWYESLFGGKRGEWISRDGDTWVDKQGNPITTKEFACTRILFFGGPRNGEVVA